jgi:hypothetical protein
MSHIHVCKHARTRIVAIVVTALVAALPAMGLGPMPHANAATPTLSRVASASSVANYTSHSVKIPASVAAGDTLVLFLTTNALTGTLGSPTGWTLLQSREGASTRGRAWTKRATAADANSTVTVPSSVYVKSAMTVSAYRSSAGTSAVTASASATVSAGATSHTSPAVAVAQAGSWLVNSWTEKSSTVVAWTPPANSVLRTSAAGTGGGKVSSIVADSNAAVPTGTAAGRVAKTSAAGGSSQLFSVVVSPGLDTGPANKPPVPAFTSSCTGMTCSFDATGSTDGDNDPLTYAWAFGDGGVGAGATPSHSYATAGTKTVTLTVGDGKTSAQTARTVGLTAVEPAPGHTTVVPQTPRTDMPKISDGEIYDIEIVGKRVFIAGTFTKIQNQRTDNTATYTQPGLASYNMDTGLVDPAFTPVFGSGGVESVEASPDGTKLYVAGGFSTVNGVARKGLVRLDPATGATVAAFTASTDARATEVAATNTTVYVGGAFTKVNNVARRSLAAVDATTGAVDTGFTNDVTLGIGTNGGLTVQRLLLTHDLTRLLVVHTGKKVAGQDRIGIALISTATKTLLPWRTRLWDDNLQYVGGVQRIYGAAISPDDSYFVVTSGSGGDHPPISDTAVAYSMNGDDNMQPKWISRAFDSVYSVAISEKAVYLGGHFTWNESNTAPDPWPGQDDVGYGNGQGLSGYGLGDAVVGRAHLSALNPADGKALEWNPGSNSFEGNKAMEVTSRGLFTGGDAATQGGYNVGRIAFFDFSNQVPSNGVETTITEPIAGRVVGAAKPFNIKGTATATGGVNRVQVELLNLTTKTYLQDDLKTWGAWNAIDTTLETPGAASTTWSLPLIISGNNRLQLLAKAFAKSGTGDATKDLKTFETFGLDDAPPTVSVTSPASGVVKTQTFVVSGTAADDRGVSLLAMAIRDKDQRYLQADGSVAGTYYAFKIKPDVLNATSTTWSQEITVPSEGLWQAQVRAIDTGNGNSLSTSDRNWTVSANGQAPTVSISSPATVIPPTTPQPVKIVPGQPMTFTGSATDDEAITSIDIALVNNSTQEKLTIDGTFGVDNGLNLYRLRSGLNTKSYNWTYTTPFDLTPGNYTFAVVATDNEGIATSQANWAVATLNAQVPGDAPPKATLTTKGKQPPGQSLNLNLTGNATDDKGVTKVLVSLRDADTNRYLKSDGTTSAQFATIQADVVTPGTATEWSLPVALPNQGDWNVTAFAVDTAGQRDLATTDATARYPIYPGDAAPTLNLGLLSPTEGTPFQDGRIFVSGRAEDDQSMAKVEVAIVDSAGKYLNGSGGFQTGETWRTAFMTSPGTKGSNFSYTTPVLPEGAYKVQVRATDQHDLVSADPPVRNVTVTIPAGNNKPVAVLVKSCNENVCTFDARSSTDENAPTLTYSWVFGNGTGTGPVPTRTYTAANTYTVTLTAKDEWGVSSDAITTTVTIAEPAGNVAPVALINEPACSGLSCNFSAVGTKDPNTGDSITYAWSFADPTSTNPTATGSATSHAFSGPGTYTVTLTATDGWGNAHTVTRDVTVTAP